MFDIEHLGVIISAIALGGTILYNVVTHLNFSTIEIAFLTTKEKILTLFIRTTVIFILFLIFLILTAYFVYENKLGDAFVAFLYSLLLIFMVYRSITVYHVYFFDNETLIRIISRLDDNYILVDILDENGYKRKLISINTIENKRLYSSKENLMNKEYNIENIKKAFKIDIIEQ
ncbi:hypothetical protein ACYSNR_04285 [Enterococcus sp. LJL128]